MAYQNYIISCYKHYIVVYLYFVEETANLNRVRLFGRRDAIEDQFKCAALMSATTSLIPIALSLFITLFIFKN